MPPETRVFEATSKRDMPGPTKHLTVIADKEATGNHPQSCLFAHMFQVRASCAML